MHPDELFGGDNLFERKVVTTRGVFSGAEPAARGAARAAHWPGTLVPQMTLAPWTSDNNSPLTGGTRAARGGL